MNNLRDILSNPVRQRQLAVASAIVVFVLFFWLLTSLFNRNETIVFTGPINRNALKSRVLDDNLYFYTGSTFARQNIATSEITSLTGHLTMPTVITYTSTNAFALIETTNHEPGTIAFEVLFDNADLRSRIAERHFWLVNYSDDSLTLVTDTDHGPLNTIYQSTSGDIFASSINEDGNTVFHTVNSQGRFEVIGETEGVYSVIRANDNGQFILFSSSFYWFDTNTNELLEITEQFTDAPLLANNGDIVGLLVQPGNNPSPQALVETIENDHEDENRGVHRIIPGEDGRVQRVNNSRGSLLEVSGVGNYMVIEKAESDFLDAVVYDGDDMATGYRFEGLEGVSVTTAYALTNGDFLIIDVFGNVYVQNSADVSLRVIEEITIPNFCGDGYCVEDKNVSELFVEIYEGGSLNTVRETVVSELIARGYDPTQFEINWLDYRSF